MILLNFRIFIIFLFNKMKNKALSDVITAYDNRALIKRRFYLIISFYNFELIEFKSNNRESLQLFLLKLVTGQ